MKIDWISLIAIVIMLGSVVFLTSYYINRSEKECIKNPLVFGALQMEEIYGYKFTGIGILHTPINIESPQISFNSTDLDIN